MDQFVEDLKHWMAHRKIKSAIILGFSDGANVAMKFALRYPTHVRALILNGGNYDATGVKRSVQFPIEVGYRLCCFFFTLFIGGPTKHGNARFDGERAPFNT